MAEEGHQLIQPDAAPIAGSAAMAACHRAFDGQCLATGSIPVPLPLAADDRRHSGADPPYQALRLNSQQAGADQVGFDTHIDKTAHRAGRIVGMQGGEHQMAGRR